MADPAPAPTPAPAPAAPVAPPAPQPGWKSTEAWLTFLVIVLGALIESGLVGEASQLGKMVTFGLMVLKVMGYQHQRTQLKLAHVAPANDNAPASAREAQAGFARVGVMMLVAIVLGVVTLPYLVACSASSAEIKKVENVVADCTTGELAKVLPIAVASAGPLIEGGLTWSDAEAAAMAMGGDIGGCFLSELADLAKHGLTAVHHPAAAAGSEGVVDRYRTATRSSHKFKTAAGVR